MDSFEHGKAAILDHVMLLMTARGIDPALFTFEWVHEPVHETWNLVIGKGGHPQPVSFYESVVWEWLTNPNHAAKYAVRIPKAINRLEKM